MAPFPNVNKVVLAQIQIYRGGKGLVLAGRLKDKQIRGFSNLLMRHHKIQVHTQLTVTQIPWGERGIALGEKKNLECQTTSVSTHQEPSIFLPDPPHWPGPARCEPGHLPRAISRSPDLKVSVM